MVWNRPPFGQWGPAALLAAWLGLLLLVAPARTQGTLPQPIDPTIVGGQEAEPGAWPWQVALVQHGRDLYDGQFCGGSLIAPQWVVTAGHCVDSSDPDDLQVAAGIHNLQAPDAGYLRLDVAEIIIHPDYGHARQYDSDIALLKLASPAGFRPAAPGQLPIAGITPDAIDDLMAGAPATVTGWGNRSTHGGDFPAALHQVVVPLMDQAACREAYPFGITNNMLCAGLAAGGKDACQGDSGGPLMTYSDERDRWELTGIVSWGIGCAQPGLPGVYTRVARFGRWLADETAIGVTPDFAIDLIPARAELCAGETTTSVVALAGSYNFTQAVNLSTAALPPGAAADFAPARVTPPGQSTLALSTASVPKGEYHLMVRGTSPGMVREASFDLTIAGSLPDTPMLIQPEDGRMHASATPTLDWAAVDGADAYLLQVAVDPAFSQVIYSAPVTESHHIVRTRLSPQTRYYWRVQAQNGCGESEYAAPRAFSTGWAYCRAVEQPIPDEDLVGLVDALHLSTGGVIDDVDVYLNVDHSWVAEISASVEHNLEEQNLGRAILMEPDTCDYRRNVLATFNDEAAQAVGQTCHATPPAIRGDVRPVEPLADFDSHALAGTWQLRVADVYHGDQGQLVEWCLMPSLSVSYCDTVSDIPAAECAALEAVYAATRGWEWADAGGWLNGSAACDWVGVDCEGGNVRRLALPGNGLAGRLPEALGALGELEAIELSGNPGLGGSLPAALTGLRLSRLWYDGTGLCTPDTPGFAGWLAGIEELRQSGHTCGLAYVPVLARPAATPR